MFCECVRLKNKNGTQQSKIKQKSKQANKCDKTKKIKTGKKHIFNKGLWRNGNASDSGSEDSRFDPW